LGSIPGVAEVGAHVGRAILSDQVVGSDAGQLWVTIDPDADHDATLAAVEDVAAGYPGLATEVTNYPKERIGEVLPALDEPVVIRLYGQDLDILQGEAERCGRSCRDRGVVDPRLELPPLEPAMEIEDLDAAQEENIKPGDVRRAATTLISGSWSAACSRSRRCSRSSSGRARSEATSRTSTRSWSTPGRRACGSEMWPRCESRRPRPRSDTRPCRDTSTSSPASGREVGDVLAEVDGRLGELQFPLEYHAEVLQDSVERQATDRQAVALVVEPPS
jgi:hypothetical protein